ncbi:cytochrome b [Legionella worsleiensis]|uniref:Cytochrome b-561 transmembrane protein n=1 Tax=Legionella worsleiensis TaxID=45076 RepID=A0A0W1A6G3_9GAMM|nr:cytochrome b [Legionella worsleiensis]KTD76945.1 cytochrome b-561 transmembrane protein [Legionella worsleiensis]STY33384.1 cybB cytochrome b-561 transmembrane protein [Legionella worsleiensis]
MKQTIDAGYSSVTKFFHWLIALLVIGMLCMGFFLEDIPEQYQGTAYMLHKSTGITLLFLMLMRAVWVGISGKPALPSSIKPWEKKLARFVQYGFYVLLFIMPMSGWIMSVAADRVPSYFGLFKMPLPWITPDTSLVELMKDSHEVIAWILILFICLHVLGALKHHFIDKNNILRRMLPGQK